MVPPLPPALGRAERDSDAAQLPPPFGREEGDSGAAAVVAWVRWLLAAALRLRGTNRHGVRTVQ
eukprot:358273-Chlamydomonas_euryale.AAC.1